MNVRLQYNQVKRIVLMMIYEVLARDLYESVTIKDLKSRFSGVASKAFMDHAIQDLYEDGFVYFGTGAGEDTDWRITRNGLVEAEATISHDKELYEIVVANLDSEKKQANTTASNDTWSPLPVERSGENYNLAVDASETAFNEIKGSNGYSESEPEERDQIVWSLGEGLKQIKEGLPTRDQVVTMLVRPFKYISEKFAGAAMGEMAKAAVKALLDWLG